MANQGSSAILPPVSNKDEPAPIESFEVRNFVKDHKFSICLGIVILAVLILIIVGFTKVELFGDVFYLDQMAMLNTDPTDFKYTGNERDVLGESGRDYYLMNQTYANNQSAPQLLEGNLAYVNQTQYLDMPVQYRPHPLDSRLASGQTAINGRFVRPMFRSNISDQTGNVISQETGPESLIF